MCTARRHAARRTQAGVTLIELVLFIVIVGVAVVGILGVMDLTTRNSVDPQLRKQALAIAEGMLDEIEGARFTFCAVNDPAAETAISVAGCGVVEAPGIQGGATQRPYDNVNDYVAKDGSAITYTTDVAGNPFSSLANQYAATVSMNSVALNGIAAPNVLHIQVSVAYGDKQQVVLDGYRTRYAPNSIP
ncbi:type II secretion system protein [Janthinobacterium sp. LS2A]|uniref:type IV pilus modification PilV family protein n=1 Tax=unclassified Janthinobacterium TaxID=2610881 RepID=UPI0029F56682|nr:type II secretion system protein [Janthinobacterium sp. GMG2]MDX8121684.1 type II secretion system protein [Janthinobacterium sp. GMG2]